MRQVLAILLFAPLLHAAPVGFATLGGGDAKPVIVHFLNNLVENTGTATIPVSGGATLVKGCVYKDCKQPAGPK